MRGARRRKEPRPPKFKPGSECISRGRNIRRSIMPLLLYRKYLEVIWRGRRFRRCSGKSLPKRIWSSLIIRQELFRNTLEAFSVENINTTLQKDNSF